MIKGTFLCWENGAGEPAANIRRAVFEQELGWSREENEDGLDEFATHAIVYDGNEIAGAGRVAYLDGKYEIARICVLPQYRRKQYADFLLRMMCDRVFCVGAQTVWFTLPLRCKGLAENVGFEAAGEIETRHGEAYQPMKLEVSKFHMQCGHAYCPAAAPTPQDVH